VAEIERTPGTPSRLRAVIREARLRSERDAVAQAIPPDVANQLHDACQRHAALEARRHDLETGGPAYWHTPAGHAGAAVDRLASRIESERRRADDPQASRSDRRAARYQTRDLAPQFDDAKEHWMAVAGPEHARLTEQIDHLTETVDDLRERRDHRIDWLDRHPEALRRLERLDRELDAYRPQPPERALPRAIGHEPPSRPIGPEISGPDLGLGL
jgi:hypothetical protein